jgi:DNA polymerase-4
MGTLFGVAGRELVLRARGLDDRPIEIEHAAKSISSETTYDRDVMDGNRLRATLRGQSEEVGRRLRENGLCAAVVRVKIRWPDFTLQTRQTTLAQPTDQDQVIHSAALGLLDQFWKPGKAVRLLGLAAGGLAPAVHQLSLWDTPNEKERRLLDALDTLRQRFGEQAVLPGRKLKKR